MDHGALNKVCLLEYEQKDYIVKSNIRDKKVHFYSFYEDKKKYGNVRCEMRGHFQRV